MSDILVKAEGVSKKFCKSLRYSMFYGIQDITQSVFGIRPNTSQLKEKEFWAVDNISFELKRGECLGLIGPNGSGKSTLLKILNGIISPDKGRVSIKGKVGALIEIGAGFHPQLTGRENIYINGSILGFSKKDTDKRLDAIIDFSGIEEFIDTPVKNYSSGMRVRLGFSIAAQLEADVLFIDEVLAVGDAEFRQKCYNKIKSEIANGVAAILVTHNMFHVYHVCTSGLSLYKGKSACYGQLHDAVCDYERRTSSVCADDMEPYIKGKTDIQFVKAELLGKDRMSRSQFNTGESFRLRIHYKSKIECDITCILSLVSYDLGNIFNVSNKHSSEPVHVFPGEGYISIDFYDVLLMSGGYYFNIWFNDQDDKEHYFLKYNAMQFRMLTPNYHANYYSGKFELRHKWLQ